MSEEKKELTSSVNSESINNIDAYNSAFLQGHALAMIDWKIKFPNMSYPIIKDENGRLVWINRNKRRSLKKK